MSKKVSARPKTGMPNNHDNNSKLDKSTNSNASSKVSGVGKFTQTLKSVAAKNLSQDGKKLLSKQKTMQSQLSNSESIDNNPIINGKTISGNVDLPHVKIETVESKIFNVIEESTEMLTNKNYFEKESTGEQYELVEKEILRKFELDNEELKILKNTHGEKYNQLVGKHSIAVADLKKLKSKFKGEEKMQEEDINKIFELEQANTEIIIYNQKLRDMLSKELSEKENIYKAIVAFQKKFEGSINKDIKKTLKGFTHEMFLPMDKKKEDEEKIKDLTAKLRKLEKESKNLDVDIEGIKKTLNEERIKSID